MDSKEKEHCGPDSGFRDGIVADYYIVKNSIIRQVSFQINPYEIQVPLCNPNSI